MDDALDLVLADHALDEILVAGIADEQRHPLRQEGGKAGGQVVDHDDALAGFHQRQNHVAADIAGASGDEHGHWIFTSPDCSGDASRGSVKRWFRRR